MKLRMKREGLKKMNPFANEGLASFDTARPNRDVLSRFCHGRTGFESSYLVAECGEFGKWFRINRESDGGA